MGNHQWILNMEMHLSILDLSVQLTVEMVDGRNVIGARQVDRHTSLSLSLSLSILSMQISAISSIYPMDRIQRCKGR